MIFWLMPSVFVDKYQQQLDIIRINALNNHAFVKFDIEDVNISSWTTRKNASDWEELYRCWISDATKFRQTNIVKVCGNITAPSFDDDIPLITLEDAAQLITMPIFLNLENSTNDLNFIKCVVDRYTRSEISKKINLMRIVPGTGGLGEVTKTLIQQTNELILQFKMFVMTDSDRIKIDEPQAPVMRVKALCLEKNVTHHILERRMIENYYPLSLIYENTPSPVGTDIYNKIQAFDSLNREQRYCFHLKTGLKGVRDPNSIYAGIPEEILALLDQGFFKIAERYGQEENQDKIHNLMHNFSENSELKILANKMKNHLRTPV